jgi:K(+)-stimulated pyrophosphate-energized sodium pump
MNLDLLVSTAITLTGIFGLSVIALLYFWIRKQESGTERMQEIGQFIQIGANAFLRREFITITPFIVILAILLYFVMPEGNWQIAVGFVTGAVFSLVAIYVGIMRPHEPM